MKKTPALLASIVIAIIVISCYFSVHYFADTLTSQIPTNPITYPSLSPKPVNNLSKEKKKIISNNPPYSQLVWQQYTSNNFGLKFMYPVNITIPSEQTNVIALQRYYGDMVDITRFDTNDSLDIWMKIQQNTNAPILKTLTTFQGYPAYYIAFTALPMVSTDLYVVKVHNHVYQIAYRTMDQGQNYSQAFNTLDKKAIDKILSSIQFLQ